MKVAPRVVIVGAGLMGRWHAHAARRLGARLTTVVDARPDRAAALASTFRDCGTAATLSAALATGPADVVHVCTPVESHEDLVRQAVEAGLPALVEKPLAPTAETTERLLALAAEHGVAVCPVHQYLYQSGVVRAARLLAQLGTLRQVDAFACSAGAEGGGDAARDAVALDILIHPLSLLRRLVTPEVAVLEWHVRRTAPGELRAVAAAAGAAIGIVVSTHGRPTHHTLRLVADAGTLHLDLFHGFCVAESGAVSRGRKVARPFALGSAMVARASANLLQRAARREPAYPGLREIIGRFYVAVAGGGPVPVPPEETVDVARARDMIAAVLPVRGALP